MQASQTHALRLKPTCGSLRTWVHKPRTAHWGPAWFIFRNIQQLSPICLLIATNLPIPEGWTVRLTVPAPGIEPGPVRLVVQEIRRRATISTWPRRQCVTAVHAELYLANRRPNYVVSVVVSLIIICHFYICVEQTVMISSYDIM